MFIKSPRIAVLIPCYNEEISIGKVIKDFREYLPEAAVYVYDNNSSDNSIAIACNAGAIVRHVVRQGKGFVVQRMFADIEADIYVMVDGDATYDATSARAMVTRLIDGGLDMLVAKRINRDNAAYRKGHVLGNLFFSWAVRCIFGKAFTDILSGYRVFSRRFVKSYDCFSKGFEIETDMTVFALRLHMPTGEIDTPYFARPENSQSKLSTYKDGLKILKKILSLFVYEKPRLFFGLFAALFMLISIVLGIPLLYVWLNTGLVPRFPTAILCSALAGISVTLLSFGLLLDSVQRARRTFSYLAYLSIRRITPEEYYSNEN